MAKFVVIIPTYNAARYLPETIGSVQAQDVTDWEIIVADDGSSDDSAAVVARLAAADPRIRWLSQPNAGVSVARNLGARHLPADCQYLWFLDSDDMLVSGALRRMGAYLEVHREVGLLGCHFELFNDDGTPVGPGKHNRWAAGRLFNLPRRLADDEPPTPFETFFCGLGQGPSALYRRSVYERTEGWEPRLRVHEDTDMFCQMALLAEVHYLPDRLYLKRIHAGQSTDPNDNALVRRLWDCHAIFREKWDQRVGRDEQEIRRLEAARRFYHYRFQPAWDMKLVLIIWRDQLRGKWNRSSALYSVALIWRALRAMLNPASWAL